ncbi:MAG: DUF1987 domain-containing protein [Leptospira sp.]|nr:DUF1987 domain-containing protein [Leptospira sp.]
MDKIYIEKTKISPEIILDFEAGNAEINGESYPENAVAFYKPVFEWITGIVSANRNFVFNFRLNYFNTSSSKVVIDILDALQKYHTSGGKVSVVWYYKEDDDDMLEAGEEFASDVDLSFELKAFK